MEIQVVNSLKKYSYLAMAVFLVLAVWACKKDNSSLNDRDFLVKARVNNASVLFNTTSSGQRTSSNSSSFDESTLLKQNKSGNVEPVYFVKENGDSITMDISRYSKLSEEYLVLSGHFQLKDGFFSDVLVNIKTENIYGLPTYSTGYNWLYSPEIERDKDGNMYFLEHGHMVYKVNVSSPNNIKIEEYIPSNQSPDFFMVNPNGICFYRSSLNGSYDLKFRLLSGSILTKDNLFGKEDPYTTFFEAFYGFDGDYYVPQRQEVPNIIGGIQATLYRVNFDGDEPALSPVRTYWDRQLSFIKNHVRLSYFAIRDGIIEIDGTPDNETTHPLSLLNGVYYDANNYGLTSQYYIMPALNDNLITKISLTDYSTTHIELGDKTEYEFYDVKFGINSEYFSFSGLRYKDGKNIIGSVDANNVVTMEVVEQGKPINLVKLN